MVPLLADVVFSLYLGASQTRPSDLHVVQQTRENDATLHKVTWHGYPFRFEIYYGLRLTYTPPHYPSTRFALDYTHFKIYEEPNDAVFQDGTWHGATIRETSALSERVQSFEITHGLNMLGLAMLERVSGQGDAGAYVGGGPVFFVPHAESRVDGLPGGDGYEYGGSGFEAVAGVRGCVGVRPLFTEIKYSHGAPSMTIARGRADMRVDTVHELGGIDLSRC
jgi:hypothetical protein